jgi:prephenate dehydratase/prephenate dehydrogenase
VKNTTKHPIIGIVGGRGILGKVFQQNFEAAGIKVLISGRKPDGKKVLTAANLIRKSDIVIVSVFLKSTAKILAEVVPKMRKNQLLVDFTSVKIQPLEIMKKAKSEVVGLHPMFGEVANLRGKNIFACKIRGGKLWQILRRQLESFGLKIHEVPAKQHDELAAIHQASAHILSLAFALLLKKKRVAPQKLFEIASPSTQLLLLTSGRMLAQNSEMYTDIQLLNPRAKKTVVELAEILANLACDIAGDERKILLKSFNQAGKFFGKWSNFAAQESNRIFENLAEKEIPKVSQGKIEVKKIEKSQKKVDFAVLGQNTQTQLALFKFAEKLGIKNMTATFHKNVSFSTVPKVFESVLKGEAQTGFIPLENFSIGPVRETMRQLFEASGEIKILQEFTHEIHHSLIGQKPTGKITHIFAHPQAHAQCQKFLQKNYPQAELIPVANAGEAIRLASNNANTLAIGPEMLLNKAKNVDFIKSKIEDDKNNRTRFILITKHSGKKFAPKKLTKNAIAFFFSENKSGQLAAALDIFAEHKINLSRIESIPTEKKQGEFFFFTECEKNKSLPAALKKLGKITNVINLGSY